MLKQAITISLLLILAAGASAQSNIVFHHLTTANGLSYSGVNDMCTDLKGNLWIATGNGLNMFNGKTVVKYQVADNPELVSNRITQVLCDDKNRVWIMTDRRNIAMIDEGRQLHKVSMVINNEPVKQRLVLFSKTTGVVLFTENGMFSLNEKPSFAGNGDLTAADFSKLTIRALDTLRGKRYKHVFRFDDDKYLLSQDTVFYVINFRTKEVEKKCMVHTGNLLVKWGKDSVLMYNTFKKQFEVVNFGTGAITTAFENLSDQLGHKPDDYFIYAEKLHGDEYIFTTRKKGMYILNRQTGKLFNYRHHAADPSTIGSNQVYRITINKEGWVFLVADPYGVSYFNSREIIGTQSIFQDSRGRSYDGYITSVASDDDNTYYLGTSNGLIEWNRNANTTEFIDFPGQDGHLIMENEDVQAMCFDQQHQLWVSTTSKGILVIDKNRQLLKHIKNTGRGNGTIRLRRAYILQPGLDGFIWASGENGICRINSTNYAVDYFDGTALAGLENNFVSPLYFADPGNLWMGITDGGVLHYNIKSGQTERFNKDNGLSSNYIFSINQDNDHNIFIGTDNDLNILQPNGSIRTVTTKDGLLISRVESLIADRENNRMWIGNDIGLGCYSYRDSTLTVFDERYGLSIYGFRVNAYYQNRSGEFVFGTPRGIQYFRPEDLFNHKIKLNAQVSRIETRGVSTNISQSEKFEFSAAENDITFYFTSIDFSGHLNTFYEYKLQGADKAWVKVADQNSVHYSSLPAGKYVFKLRVSNNGKDWHEADNEVTVVIAASFWKSWWFRLMGLLAGVSLILYVVNYFRQKQRRKEQELETELVITYFASQINKHNNTGSLLWDIAKNCISRLHFEDCVIYLLDEQRKVLVQKAAYGPKNPVDFTIHQRIEIAVGEGIVGTVAKTGRAEIISNTTADRRYIVDDQRRNSEIAVPILVDEKVVGVIDSEHHRRNFFNHSHLKMLNTIATLCASQMQVVNAEEQKRKAEIALLQNKQKALESRLQSLRLQMNPHFLFNALNSVQQMILANEEMVATRYLSRFSKLLRAILVHSDQETITLKEELEILNLYVELESIRFKGAFQYQITADESIDIDEVRVPTLLVQPFVENAIWHGLMHKESDRKLQVSFTEKDEWLHCVVEDNGVGREKARAIKGIVPNGITHQSKGIAVSTERLKAMKTKSGLEGRILFTDLAAADGTAAGTRVAIDFPIQT